MSKFLQQEITNSKKKLIKNKNMGNVFTHISKPENTQIQNSILRGEILRFSLMNEDVNNCLADIKNSNPKYLKLIVDIISVSMTKLSGYDIEVSLSLLLKQVCKASYSNHEALDFTEAVLESVDTLTSKCYLNSLSGGVLLNNNLKKQFKASISFLKYVVGSLSTASDLSKQSTFMNAIKVLINENVDYKKIELLPKLKYVLDGAYKTNYNLDINDILYGSIPVSEIEECISSKNFNRLVSI